MCLCVNRWTNPPFAPTFVSLQWCKLWVMRLGLFHPSEDNYLLLHCIHPDPLWVFLSFLAVTFHFFCSSWARLFAAHEFLMLLPSSWQCPQNIVSARKTRNFHCGSSSRWKFELLLVCNHFQKVLVILFTEPYVWSPCVFSLDWVNIWITDQAADIQIICWDGVYALQPTPSDYYSASPKNTGMMLHQENELKHLWLRYLPLVD